VDSKLVKALRIAASSASLIVLVAACVPSYTFSGDAGTDAASSDASAIDGAAADASHGADADADARADADTVDSAAEDSAPSPDVGIDAPPPSTVTVDTGFPKLATIVGGPDAGANAVSTTLSTTFDVPAGGRLLVAVVIWGQFGGSDVWPVLFAGGGYTWTAGPSSVSIAGYYHAVGAGVWTAWAPASASGVTVTATRSNTANADAMLAVYSLAGASQTLGGSTATVNGFGADGGAPLTLSLAGVLPQSFVAFGMLDGNGSGVYGVRGTPLPSTMYDDYLMSPSGNGLALGHMTAGLADGGPAILGTDYPTPVQTNVGVAIELRGQ
jgi:hypothetical protein